MSLRTINLLGRLYFQSLSLCLIIYLTCPSVYCQNIVATAKTSFPPLKSADGAISSQPAKAIRGQVIDSKNSQKLEGAYISDPESGFQTFSDEEGFFSIDTEEIPKQLYISLLGYKKKEVSLQANIPKLLVVPLVAVKDTLDEIEVYSNTNIYIREPAQSLSISAADIKEMPSLLGEPDIIRVLKTQAGVGGSTEMDGGYYVRGGSYTHNIVYMDGMPLLNLSHLMGISSIVQGDVLNNAQLYKSSFPVEYGGGLASYLILDTRNGSLEKHKFKTSLGMLSSSLLVEGPISRKNKSSYLVSIRKNYYDILVAAYNRMNESEDGLPTYSFWDGTFKLNTSLKEGQELSLTGFISSDFLDRTRESANFELRSSWKNKLLSLKWTNKHHSGINYKATSGVSTYSYNNNILIDNRQQNTNLTVVWNNQFQGSGWLRENIKLTGGISYMLKKYIIRSDLKTLVNDQIKEQDIILNANKVSVFGELSYFWKEKLKIRLANRMELFYSNNLFIKPSPQLDFSYSTGQWQFDTGISRTVQFQHMISILGFSMPADLMYPATSPISPLTAWQASGSIKKHLGKKAYTQLAVYKKWVNNLSEIKDGHEVAFESPDKSLSQGSGIAYGAEFTLAKDKGRLTGQLNYSYTRITQQLPNINNNEAFSPFYDIPHRVNVNTHLKLGKGFALMASWFYSMGALLTAPESLIVHQGAGGFKPKGQVIPVYNERNNFRMPASHRLDLGIELKWSRKLGNSSLFLGVYNAYNQANPFFVYFTGGEEKNSLGIPTIEARQKSLVPFIPSISYTFELR